MKELNIEPAKEGKGRTFTATLLAYVTADSLWTAGNTSTDTIRPVWMMLGGTDNELKPFVANLQLGRKAEIPTHSYSRKKNQTFEILKSAGFQAAWQRTQLGSIVTLFAPDLFRLDPGMVDPKGVEFCVLPDRSWLDTINVDPAARDYIQTMAVPEERIEELLRLAPLFTAYLDRRTRCPLIPDQRFYVQILCAALMEGLATWTVDPDKYYGYYDQKSFGIHKRHRYFEYETSSVGLAPGIAFEASHETLERFLAEQVKLYFDQVKDLL